MEYNCFNKTVDNGLNGVLSWFGINLKISFQYIAQICFAMFCNLANISHPADLEIYFFHVELPIELI